MFLEIVSHTVDLFGKLDFYILLQQEIGFPLF